MSLRQPQPPAPLATPPAGGAPLHSANPACLSPEPRRGADARPSGSGASWARWDLGAVLPALPSPECSGRGGVGGRARGPRPYLGQSPGARPGRCLGCDLAACGLGVCKPDADLELRAAGECGGGEASRGPGGSPAPVLRCFPGVGRGGISLTGFGGLGFLCYLRDAGVRHRSVSLTGSGWDAMGLW